MALPRKDVRMKLDPPMHAALAVVCETDQLDMGEWIEELIVRELHRRIHASKNIYEGTARLGITANRREPVSTSGESTGAPGKGAKR